MPVANSNQEDFLIVFNPVDDEMCFEWMNSDGRFDLISFARDAWISSYQIKYCEKFIVVAFCLVDPEHKGTLLGDRNDVFFCFDRKFKTHDLLARAIASAKSSSFDLMPAPLWSPASTKFCMAAILSFRV
jgi:hypothetical protein